MNLAGAAGRTAVLAAVAVATVLLGVLALRNTEWVDETVPRAPTGKAADSPTYALERLLAATGAVVEARIDLSSLPPAHATLVLLGWNWGVLPDRDQALRDWVAAGGHLVLSRWSVAALGKEGWIPVEPLKAPPPRPDTAPVRRPPEARAKAPGVPFLAFVEEPCWRVREPQGLPVAYPPADHAVGLVPEAPAPEPDDAPADAAAAPADDGAPPAGAAPAEQAGLQMCAADWTPLESSAPALWALGREAPGAQILRIAVGNGSVTVMPGSNLLDNHHLLRGDNSLIALAALQAGTGSRIWLVADGGGGLLRWIWQQGASAVLAALLALALWLWRAGARFGPPMAAPRPARRSMVEQITGTADFLWRRSPGALHAAQLRALDETAGRRLPDYARLDGDARAGAIARATGYDAGALARAMDAQAAARPAALGPLLTTLELARRALAEAPVAGRPAPAPAAPAPLQSGDEQ